MGGGPVSVFKFLFGVFYVIVDPYPKNPWPVDPTLFQKKKKKSTCAAVAATAMLLLLWCLLPPRGDRVQTANGLIGHSNAGPGRKMRNRQTQSDCHMVVNLSSSRSWFQENWIEQVENHVLLRHHHLFSCAGHTLLCVWMILF
jgi:hypothetical protein